MATEVLFRNSDRVNIDATLACMTRSCAAFLGRFLSIAWRSVVDELKAVQSCRLVGSLFGGKWQVAE